MSAQVRTRLIARLAVAAVALLATSCSGGGGGAPAPANRAPTASFAATPATGILPVAVSFDASASRDADGSIRRYSWDFADGGTAEGRNVQHTFVKGGGFEVRLTVTDDDGATAHATVRVVSSSRVAAPRYTLTVIPTLGGPETFPLRVNNRGQVTGYAQVPTGTNHAFLFSNGATRDLGTLGGPESIGHDLNDAGEVVGLSTTSGLLGHAFRYREGTMTDLGTLGGPFSDAVAINAAGRITGVSEDASLTMRSYIYDQGNMTDIGNLGGSYAFAAAINDKGEIAGSAETPAGGAHLFLYHAGVITDLGGGRPGSGLLVTAMNEARDIVGLWEPVIGPGGLTGFLYRGDTMASLAAGYTEPSDVNLAGVVVGYAHFGNAGEAFIWSDTQGLQNLNDLLDPAADVTLVVAAGISDAGQIVGYGYRGDDTPVAVLLTPVYQ